MASFISPSNPNGGASAARSPVGNIADQARAWWDGAPTSTRVISVGLAILVVICLAAAISLAAAPSYEDLFTNLDPTDAAAIAQKLDDAHEKYQMADNDTTILVPAADKDHLRMEMVSAGLPAKTGGVVGQDYLDKIGMSTTSDVQQQYIQMAQESELAQTIESMSEVATAAVHISPGSNSPFAGDNTPPSASVVVGLKTGMTLTSDQTMGIANLVAKAIPGLDIKNVVVVDSDGNQLWDGGQDGAAGGLASNRMEAERQFSDDLRKQMQSYLDTVLGVHKSLVSVNAELNYNQVTSDQTTYGKGALLSSQDSDETYQGSSSPSSTAPAGMASNTGVPQYPSATTASSGKTGDYEKTTGTQNYNTDKTETQTQQAPGGIERLAIAVLVDQSVPPATVQSIQTYLSTLAGVTAGDPTRVVTVQSVPFSNTDMLNQQNLIKSAENAQRQQQIIQIAAVALVAIVLLIIFLKSTRMATPQRAETHELEDNRVGQTSLAYDSDDERLLDEPMSIEQVLGELPMASARPKGRTSIPEIEEQVDIKLESVRDMIKSHPQAVSLLLKGWIGEDIDALPR